MSQTPFLGTGHNPAGPDLPLGLGMLLAQDQEAMDTFAQMTAAQKSALIAYVQGCSTGAAAKERMASALHQLHSHQTQF